MFSKSVRVKLRKFHRWVAVIFGLQLVLWVGSGLYFAWLPIKVVRDEDRKVEVSPAPLSLERLVGPGSLVLPPNFQVKSLRLEQSAAGIMYRLESKEGAFAVYDAETGEARSHLNSGRIKELALTQIRTDEEPVAVNFLEAAPADYKGPLPIYQLVFADLRRTHLYVDPWSGRVLVRRTIFWRIYDFLWMLHIMDFTEREDFNNPWIRILSALALFIVGSGYMLFFWGRPPQRSS